MNCPEVAPLVSRFFDGELDGSHMRTVALHIARCPECEGELRSLESLQRLVADHVAACTDAIDVGAVWRSVSSQIEDSPRSFARRVAAWWDGLEPLSQTTVWPAFAAAAAVLMAVALWSDGGPEGIEMARDSRVEIAERVAQVGRTERLLQEAMEQIDNSAVFESIVGGVDGLMIEPKTQTAVLWINDSGDFR